MSSKSASKTDGEAGSSAASTKTSASEKAKKRERKQNVAKSAEHFKLGLAKSRKASSKADFADAAESFTLAIEMRPSNARYYFARANCYRSMGEYRKSYLDYTAAVRIDENVALYFANRALVLRRMRRPAEAYEDYTRALLIDQNNGNYSFNRAVTLYELKRYDEAARDYTKAIRENKHVFRAYYNRGNCYRRMGELSESTADLRKAVTLEPRNPSAHNNLGLTLFERKMHEDAIQSFTDAIALDAENPTFYNNRGLALYQNNDLEAALADMNEAVARDSSKNPDPNYYFNRGNTRLARREPLKALADFGEALRLRPGDARYLHSLGLARQQIEGDEHLALAQFRRALECDPGHTPSRYHCGLMLHRLGELEEAVAVFDHVLSEVKDDRLVYESRGLVYQDMGKHAHAVKDFTMALQLDDDLGENYYHRGESRLRLGQLDAALDEFSSAVGRSYTEPCLYNARGMTKRKLGQLDEAIKDLDLAISRSPDPEFYLNRSTCYLDVDDPGSAEADMTEALAVSPDDYRLLQQRGVARYVQHKFDPAITDFFCALEALELASAAQLGGGGGPGMGSGGVPGVAAEINRYLGYAFANSSRNDRAVDHFDKVVEYGRVAEEEAMRAMTSALASGVVDLDGSGGEDGAAVAVAAAADNIRDESLRTPESVAGQLTDDYHERAKALQLCGRLEESLADFDRVIERNPRNAHAYFRRAFVHKSMSNFDRAAEDFERARALDPNNPALAISYRNIGQIEVIILCDAGREPAF